MKELICKWGSTCIHFSEETKQVKRPIFPKSNAAVVAYNIYYWCHRKGYPEPVSSIKRKCPYKQTGRLDLWQKT